MIYYPVVLIISNKFDFSTDLITYQLKNRKVVYLRLNRDQLGEYKITFDPISPSLKVKIEDIEYCIDQDHLLSIYFRAPTFLRDIIQENISEEEQLYRTQWAAFVRSLIVFENINWVNNPVETYKAEIKPMQLFYANKVGFNTPNTIISNVTSKKDNKKFAVKSLDTAIINNGSTESFIYTSILDGSEFQEAHYTSPFFIQQGLTPKTDVRITIIDREVIGIKIKSEIGIDDDWRKFGGEIQYEIFALPNDIKTKCLEYVRLFNLRFSAIDMVIYEDDYYFIEINPTGEWAWLQQNTGFKFDKLIVECLLDGYVER